MTEEDLYRDFPRISPERCCYVVAEKMHTSYADLKSRGRIQHVAMARFVAFYVMRQKTSLSLLAIGRFFKRDHSTVHHGIAIIAQRMKAQPGFAAIVNQIIEAL